MSALVPIGEFSRLTHLSVKTLRHYHEVELLVPDQVDPQTGYRRYTTTQVPDALLIGRLRDLEMPLAAVREVLRAADPDRRNAVIGDHLRRMEQALDRTRGIVTSLRQLLLPPGRPLTIDYRQLPDLTALAISGRVGHTGIAGWCEQAFSQLYAAVGRQRLIPAGPGAATYGGEFFTGDLGEVTAFVPVEPTLATDSTTIAGGRFAIAVHTGSYRDLDQTYATLGSHVAEHDQLAPGPIREHYLVGPTDTDDESRLRTEVCWPVAA